MTFLGAGIALRIGTDFEAADFAGQIDEIRVWNRGLSPIEIERYRRQRLRGIEEGLLVYYSFDSVDEGRVVADLSRYGHDGLLRGDAHAASAHAVQLAATELIQGKAADLLILALRHRDSSVRRHAAQALDKVARSDFNRVMAVALQHHDTQVRHRADESLADADLVGLREGTRDHALVMVLNHWDAAVRPSAVDALGRLTLADATEAMKVAVGHRDTVVQRRATDFLGRDELASVAVELAPPDGPVGLADRQVAEGQLVPEDYSGW